MGHVPEERTERFLTVEGTDMNTHKEILMSTGLTAIQDLSCITLSGFISQ